MAKKMTISDAVDAFDLYALYSEILDSYEEEFYTQSPDEVSDLYDLIAEHEELYEFSPDPDGDYSESFERNLKDALSIIFEELGLDGDFIDDYPEDDMEDTLEDDDMDGSYIEGYEDEEEGSQTRGDFDDFDEDN